LPIHTRLRRHECNQQNTPIETGDGVKKLRAHKIGNLWLAQSASGNRQTFPGEARLRLLKTTLVFKPTVALHGCGPFPRLNKAIVDVAFQQFVTGNVQYVLHQRN
jgi:hypothetical protein